MKWFISHGTTENLGRLSELARDKSEELWTVNRNASSGDRIIIYLKAPTSSCTAIGTVTGKRWSDGARHGWPGYKMIRVRIDRMINPPVHIRKLRAALPKWPWTKMPKSQVAVPAEFVPRLLELLSDKSASTARGLKAELRRSVDGGGFGTFEENQEVDRAAIRFVKSYYAKNGWTVADRQRDRCGYDLHAERVKSELHLEVKGTSGSEPSFIITENELNCARRDSLFRLCIVTDALNRTRRLCEYSGKQMEKIFDLTPIAYFGRTKK
jgi:hypothetical protein